MIQALWQSFPRLIEENINGLLDTAEPNSSKAFMLYKTCVREDIWTETFAKFQDSLTEFYSRPKTQRRKSHLDALLERPLHSSIYRDFHLDFRTAYISEQSVYDLASWAYNLIRVSKKVAHACASLEVMNRTIHSITHPPAFEKAENITFDDFCSSWKKTVFNLFGRAHEAEFTDLIRELEWMNGQLKVLEAQSLRQLPAPPPSPFTHEELDWVSSVRAAASIAAGIPQFKGTSAVDNPFGSSPEKQPLRDLSRIAALFEKSKTTKVEEVMKNREAIRRTLIIRCDEILQPTHERR